MPYVSAMDAKLDDRVDFAQPIKVYRSTPEGERRYSPAGFVAAEVVPAIGHPDKKHVCTSHVERQNLTMRMQIRRLTRLTNGFSKKRENLWAALCLWFAYYNFCRIRRSLRVTPAMEAAVASKIDLLKTFYGIDYNRLIDHCTSVVLYSFPMGSDFLFARPSFLFGVARTLDMRGLFNRYNVSPTARTADARAMRSDWMMVGRDIQRAAQPILTELTSGRRGQHQRQP